MAYSILYQLSYNQFIYTFTNFTKLMFPCYKHLYTHMAGLQSNICHRRFPFRLYLLRLCHNICVHFCMAYSILYQLSLNHFIYTFTIFTKLGFPCYKLLYTHMACLQSNICHRRFLFRLYPLRYNIYAIHLRYNIYAYICHRRFLFRLYLLRYNIYAIHLRYNIYASIFVWHIPYSISYHITVLCIL